MSFQSFGQWISSGRHIKDSPIPAGCPEQDRREAKERQNLYAQMRADGLAPGILNLVPPHAAGGLQGP